MKVTKSSDERACRWFMKEALKRGFPVSAFDVAKEVFGGGEEAQHQSAMRIAGICRENGLLIVSIDLVVNDITPAGLEFIGKSSDA
jgi:hypothetical protein